MLRTIFNLISGRTRRWNNLREPKLREIENLVLDSPLSSYSNQYFPFVMGAVQLIDDFLSPHKNSDAVDCNPNSISYEQYSELLNITTEILIQIHINVSNGEILEIIKTLYMESTKRSDEKFEDLEIHEFKKNGDPNLLAFSSFMFSEFRRIANDESDEFFQGIESAIYIQSTYQYVIDLMQSRELNKLLSE